MRALLRDPAKPAAVELAGLSAELTRGQADLNDAASLDRALAGGG